MKVTHRVNFLVFYVFFVLLIFSDLVSAEGEHESKYAGQQNRQIKSLSSDDISELRRGGGWGLAKAAELNGMPGPAHILEMEDKIKLTEQQKNKIEKLFNTMRSQAIPLGEQLISLERQLNENFSTGRIDQRNLEKLLKEIEQVRTKLRYVHLSTHLHTPRILTKEQISLYNELRGYSQDPCRHVPQGHDPQMWRKHNGCE